MRLREKKSNCNGTKPKNLAETLFSATLQMTPQEDSAANENMTRASIQQQTSQHSTDVANALQSLLNLAPLLTRQTQSTGPPPRATSTARGPLGHPTDLQTASFTQGPVFALQPQQEQQQFWRRDELWGTPLHSHGAGLSARF